MYNEIFPNNNLTLKNNELIDQAHYYCPDKRKSIIS